jgi:hypothetical protein
MTPQEKLRQAISTDEGKRQYIAAIGPAQAEGIEAYHAAKARGVKSAEARRIGEAAKDQALLKAMGYE